MKEEVHYDDEEAAKRVSVIGWVSRDGRFYGENEHLARWNGCTRLKCECGNLHEKGWTMCKACRNKASDARYEAMPFIEWDGDAPVCLYDDDKYFFSEDDVLEYCAEEELSPSDLQLVLCEPQYAHEVEPDKEYQYILPEDQSLADIAPEISAAFAVLNAAIKAYGKPISWYPGTKRTDVKPKKPTEAKEAIAAATAKSA